MLQPFADRCALQVAADIGAAVPEKELARMIQEFDSDCDGRVTEQDFWKIMSLHDELHQ